MYVVIVWQGYHGSFLWGNDFLCRWMAWGYHLFMRNQMGKVVTTNIRGQYLVDMNWYCILVLFLCLWKVMWKYTSVKWKQFCLRHAGTSIYKTLRVNFIARDNVLLDVRYYCCAYVVYVVNVASMMCVHACCVYIACVHVVYEMLCTWWYI